MDGGALHFGRFIKINITDCVFENDSADEGGGTISTLDNDDYSVTVLDVTSSSFIFLYSFIFPL